MRHPIYYKSIYEADSLRATVEYSIQTIKSLQRAFSLHLKRTPS